LKRAVSFSLKVGQTQAMAIFMTDEELLKGMRELAYQGKLVEAGWDGWRTATGLQAEEHYLAFWAGARCVFDSLHRLGILDMSDDRLKKLMKELGNDPFCRPPSSTTARRRDLQ
jgi:hypothetical protein